MRGGELAGFRDWRRARVRVPASTSNLGAGFDVLGLALNRYLEAEYEPGPGPLRLERRGTLAALAGGPGEDLLVRVFCAYLERRGAAVPGGTLRVESEIPVARGLGSSATAVVAGIGLAMLAVGREVDREEALVEAEGWEGHLDNVAPALFGGLVAVAKDAEGRARAFPLPLSGDLGFAWAAPGVEVPTQKARAALPASVAHAVATRGLGRLAALVRGLATGDPELLRIGFEDELHVPYRLPLIPGATGAFEAAREAGAWAVTISGSGSGLIAVCAPERAAEVAEAMAEAFRRVPGPEGVVSFAARPDEQGIRVGGVSAAVPS